MPARRGKVAGPKAQLLPDFAPCPTAWDGGGAGFVLKTRFREG